MSYLNKKRHLISSSYFLTENFKLLHFEISPKRCTLFLRISKILSDILNFVINLFLKYPGHDC